MLYEDPTKDVSSDERFHVELHFSPGVNCCVQKDLPPGPGFRPHSRNNEGAEASSAIANHGTNKPKVGPEQNSNRFDGDQPAPPPLVCSVKCSRDSFQKVFGQSPEGDAFNEVIFHESDLGTICGTGGLDDVQELSETEDDNDGNCGSEQKSTKSVAKNGEPASDPIEIKTPRNSRDHTGESQVNTFLEFLCEQKNL